MVPRLTGNWIIRSVLLGGFTVLPVYLVRETENLVLFFLFFWIQLREG